MQLIYSGYLRNTEIIIGHAQSHHSHKHYYQILPSHLKCKKTSHLFYLSVANTCIHATFTLYWLGEQWFLQSHGYTKPTNQIHNTLERIITSLSAFTAVCCLKLDEILSANSDRPTFSYTLFSIQQWTRIDLYMQKKQKSRLHAIRTFRGSAKYIRKEIEICIDL